MKANSKRKVFGDAVDLLMGDMEEVTMPRGVQMLPVKSIQPFHDHPFHLYEGERLDDMIASVKEHSIRLLYRSLIPVMKCFPGIIAGMQLSWPELRKYQQ